MFVMQVLDYSHIQQALTTAHSVAEAAEAHGTLAGCLCATVGYRFEDWLAELLPDGRTEPEPTHTLRAVYESTVAALGGPEMQFAPLLPADVESIDARAAALGQWCQGFLYGLGTSAITDATQLPGDVGEVVRDFSQITRVAVDTDESLESNEGAYAELVEFVRVGVQLVFDELEPLRTPPRSPDGALH